MGMKITKKYAGHSAIKKGFLTRELSETPDKPDKGQSGFTGKRPCLCQFHLQTSASDHIRIGFGGPGWTPLASLKLPSLEMCHEYEN
jgi:hypothetical protein